MKLGFIGTGNMAGAIIGGIMSSGMLSANEIGVCDVSSEKVNAYTEKGFNGFTDPGELASHCKYIVLSVKPQNCSDVLEMIASSLKAENVIISIAAGISAAFIKSKVGFDVKVVTVMPNTPLMIGFGSTAMSRVLPTTEEEFKFAEGIFSAAGNVEEISPAMMNEVIPLNGSSPAYIYLFTKLFVDRAVELGFDKDVANRLFCNALIGSAKMMLDSGKDHQQLIDMVSSPGGTTLRGLEALKKYGIEDAVKNCFDETVNRAYELGK